MRMLLCATCSAGLAALAASPATAGSPPPGSPPDAAIAQYVEAVPSPAGPVPVGAGAKVAGTTALQPAVRAKVEHEAGADASRLIDIAQNPRFGARPVARANPAPADSAKPARPARPRTETAQPDPGSPAEPASSTPSMLGAAASTAGSGGFLLVPVLLVAITGAGIAYRVRRR